MSQQKISPQSKSFAILCGLAILGIYVCLFLLRYINQPQNNMYGYADTPQIGNYQMINHPAVVTPVPTPTPVFVDTSNWKTYTSSKYGLSFNYNPTWNVLPAVKKNGFVEIQVDPGKKFYNFQIFISPTTFNATTTLASTTDNVGGLIATNFQNLQFAVFADNSYYTFVEGGSVSQILEFDAMVRSVTFQ